MVNKPTLILVHCSDIPESASYDQFKMINDYHRDDRGFPKSSLGFYVGYHALVTGGKNYKCKEDTDEGAHCNQSLNGLSINFQSLGICWGGDGDVELPSDIHYKLLQKQIWAWQDKYNISNKNVKFHREFATWKTCPGTKIDQTWLDTLLTRPIIDTCKPERDIIKEQDKQISVLKQLLQMFINLFKK